MTPTLTPPRGPAVSSEEGLASTLTLARWRLRQTGWLLLVACLGFVSAMIIASVVPLFTGIATTSGLQTILRADPARSTITLNANVQGLSTAVLQQVEKDVPPLLTEKLGSYQQGSAFEAIQENEIQGASPASLVHAGSFSLFTADLARLQPSLNLVQGGWPASDATSLQVV